MPNQSFSEIIGVHALIEGNVQGVGFRATVKRYALSLNLAGTVRNLANGSVEIYVKGRREDIKSLFEQLSACFGGGISKITKNEISKFITYKNFEIIH